MSSAWFHSKLDNHLLGVYRFGNDYVLYPRTGNYDWNIVSNHEFTHSVLAIATAAGFIHKTFAYLAYQSPSKNRNRWKKLFQKGMHISTVAHESAATFSSLCEITERDGAKQAFIEHKVPERYQRYFLILEEVIPREIPSKLRRLFGRAIASYAFDDPLSAAMALDWETLIDKKAGAIILPRVDERFLLLTGYLKNDGAGFLAEAVEAYDENAINAQKSQKEYMIRRRAETYKFEQKVRDLLLERYGDRINSFHYDNATLTSVAGPVLDKLKDIFLANGDEGLKDYTREFADDEGIDPLFFQRRIIMPTMPLSGLCRITDLEFIQPPNLITVGKVVQDSRLSETLVIKKDEYYTRCYFFNNLNLLKPIFYSISDNFPAKAWTYHDSIILSYVPDCDFAILPDIDRIFCRPSSTSPLLLVLPGISNTAFEFLLSKANDWQYEQIILTDFPGISIFILFHVPSSTYWLIYSDYSLASLFVEEAGTKTCRLQDHSLIKRFVGYWAQVFLFEGISEGVAVAKR